MIENSFDNLDGKLTSMTGTITSQIGDSTQKIIEEIKKSTSGMTEAIEKTINTFVNFGREQTSIIVR